MKFKPTVELLSEDDILSDSSENSVIRFTPSELVNDTYKSNHSVKFVMNGYEEYVIEGNYEKLCAGETMLVNGERYVSAQSSGEAIAIFLEAELINEILFVLLSEKLASNDILEMKNTERIDARNFNAVWNKLCAEQEMNLTEEFYYEVGAIYVTAFMERASGGIKLKNKLAEVEIIDKLQIAKSLIFDNIEAKMSLGKIAQEVAMSKFHLLRSFKQVYGLTPLRLHRWLRLNRAKELLKSNRYNVSEVAYLMNYADLATFSKQFKHETKVSPSYFLKNRS